jgi:hypothetical protein
VRKQLYIFLLQGKQYKDQLSKERMAFDWFWRECQWFFSSTASRPGEGGLRISMPLLVLLWNTQRESLPKKPTKT